MNYNKTFILDSIKTLGVKVGFDEVFRDIVVCCAYSFANVIEFKEDRENEYLRIINKYPKEERELFPKILASLVNEYENAKEPIDILGDIYEDLGLIKKGNAQFFTPLEVCRVMSKITINKNDSEKAIRDKGYINVSDPACGSGRNLYASYKELLEMGMDNNKILMIGDDLDLTCCCITYIQLSLMGANAIVHHQNSLTNDRYDTFYTIAYAMNKELQEKLIKEKEKKRK